MAWACQGNHGDIGRARDLDENELMAPLVFEPTSEVEMLAPLLQFIAAAAQLFFQFVAPPR